MRVDGIRQARRAIAALGPGPLNEQGLIAHIHPLFSRVLQRDQIYLANHSLGRPLDQTLQDVQYAMTVWYDKLDEAWDDWLTEIESFRRATADLIHAPDASCIVPKSSAGQGLRAILNCYDRKIPVVTTRGEFNSIDHILKAYAQRGRIELIQVGPYKRDNYRVDDVLDRLNGKPTLVVISMVLFITGQLLTELSRLITESHARGARVLVDLYHAAGVVPVNIEELNADFAVGGCYKYLRGGPGACWLYIHPNHLDGSMTTLDTGWLAQPEPFAFERAELPILASGGNAFLESTPPILPWYQAKSGLDFIRSIGVNRLREYSMKQQDLLLEMFERHRIPIADVPEHRGAFLAIALPRADAVRESMRQRNIIVDAREGYVRLCPDILNTEEELSLAAEGLARVLREG